MNIRQNLKRTAIMVPYFGKYPPGFLLFLKSISFLSSYDWYILSDQPELHALTSGFSHIHFLSFSLEEISERASRKLGFPVAIREGYKICDLKPLLGFIFEDLIRDYAYWGYSDTDLVLGDLPHFLERPYKEEADVISFYGSFMSGPLSLFRNRKDVNTLFLKITDLEKILGDPDHYGMDENILRKNGRKGTFWRLWPSCLRGILMEMFHGRSALPHLRFRCQWYRKAATMDPVRPADLTEAVWAAERKGELHACFSDLLFSCRYMQRMKKKNWIFIWENGRMINEKGKEIAGFHMIDLKKSFHLEGLSRSLGFQRIVIGPESVTVG